MSQEKKEKEPEINWLQNEVEKTPKTGFELAMEEQNNSNMKMTKRKDLSKQVTWAGLEFEEEPEDLEAPEGVKNSSNSLELDIPLQELVDPFKMGPAESFSGDADKRRDPLYFIDKLCQRHTPM